MSNLSYIESLYRQWQADPSSVGEAWDRHFRDAESVPASAGGGIAESPEGVRAYKQGRVDSLVWAYRDIGYVYANLNPLGGNHGPAHGYLAERDARRYEELTLNAFGLSDRDLDTEFHAGRAMKPSRAPLRDILAALRETYCRSVGVEFLHIQDKRMRRWLTHRMESTRNRPRLNTEQRQIILEDLLRTQALEQALHKYFTGQKRFSIEGAEAVVPALHTLVDRAREHDIEQLAIGTTHRGRLSILNTILGMPPEEIFAHFEETHLPEQIGGSGDVKYHIGYDRVHRHEDGSEVRIHVPSNASHLESISPVLVGLARGLQDALELEERAGVLPVLLHGDAAFSGQGVVAETLNLSDLEGYSTRGTIHVVINNQIGFTTSARSGRSSVFPTDPAKVLQLPVFHVNGDDPEAVVHVMDLALRFRQEFKRDVVVDIFCFRRHGHNEGDDPSFTQPYMYRLVKNHPGVTELYGRQCSEAGVMDADEQEALARKHADKLKQAYADRENDSGSVRDGGAGSEWDKLQKEDTDPDTAVEERTLSRILERVTTIPDGFHAHPRLKKVLARKHEAISNDKMVDWSLAESAAFGSLLLEGSPVRLCGEDSVRGTFSQRHLAWWDVQSETPRSYVPLNNLDEKQAIIEGYDSPLSEYAALAFEYGYSLVRPLSLVLWEAQFGDFVNGAEVTIDNYISSAEAKWGQRSGLVLLLPHGNEGQGPDHSSGHVGRFLQLCAEDNLVVCNLTSPAQYFHLLRRQVRRGFRKPLILMTPKSLLRHPRAISPLSELAEGHFSEMLEDAVDPDSVKRILFCSGKVYYDLLAGREEASDCVCAVVRVEQLYPFPVDALRACVQRYPHAEEFAWVQEEPRNEGGWRHVREQEVFVPEGAALRYIGRPPRASSATGLHKRFVKEQKALVAEALRWGCTNHE